MAMQGACRLSKDDALTRAWAVSLAVSDVAKGVQDEASWKAIFHAVNMAEAFCHAGLCNDDNDLIAETQQTVVKVIEQARELGQLAPTAEELDVLAEFAANYSGIVSMVTHQEYFTAEQLVLSRVRRVLSGEAVPAATIISTDPSKPLQRTAK